MIDKKQHIIQSTSNSPNLFDQQTIKITRLRIPEEFIQNKPLIQNIANIIKGKVKVESYISDSDLRKSFQARQDSLFTSCQYIIETLIPIERKNEAAKTLSIITQNNPVPNVDCPKGYQDKLITYRNQLIKLFAIYFKEKESKEIIELINKAEQYVILKNGRHDLATLTYHEEFKGFSLQWNRALNAFDKETIQEFEAVKANKDLPSWFLNLSEEVQIFLTYLLKSTPTVREALLFLSSRQRELPGIPNFAEDINLLLNEEGRIIKKFPSISRSGHLASRDIQKWKEEIQLMYCQRNYNLLDTDYLGTLISPTVVPLGNAPIIGNVSTFLNNNMPIPDKKLHEILQKTIKITKTNKTLYFTNHPLNLARAGDYTPKDDPHCIKIINDAKNLAKENPELKSELDPLITAYENVLNSGAGTSYIFDYNGREITLSARECLLMLAMKKKVHITCVSGKDRTQLVAMMILAMRIYQHAHGTESLYSDTEEKRAAFVKIYTEIYCSRHGQTFAGDNAPSPEIKSPHVYLTKDIVIAIKENLGENCMIIADLIASNNEVKHFLPSDCEDYYPACYISAKKLSLQQCQSLIIQLKNLINDSVFWQGKKEKNMLSTLAYYVTTDMPAGIVQLKSLLSKPCKEKETPNTPFKMLARIYVAILNRPEDSNQRNTSTKRLYELMIKLCYANSPTQCFEEIYKEIGEIRTPLKQNQEITLNFSSN